MEDVPNPSIEALLEHASWVRALARTLVFDPNEAEDLAQETLTAALSARPAPGRGFTTWLSTTLLNVKRQRWRRDVARERFTALYARDRSDETAENLAEQADLQRTLVAHVLALEEPYREILLQRYFAARTPTEIAARTRVSVATVTSQLTRAHHKLRQRLERERGGGTAWMSALVPLVPRAQAMSIAGGILVSTKIALSVAAVVIVGVLVWTVAQHRAAPTPATLASSAPEAPISSSPAPVAPSTSPKPLESPSAPPREVAPATHADAQPVKPVGACVVHGRAVDQDDHPMGGVVARIWASQVWAEGIVVPRLPGKYDRRGWELTTSADGLFHFDAPVPTADRVSLTLEPDPFHDSMRLNFGGKRAESLAPLHEGDNDMGTLRLVATGAIRGSVHDEGGVPIADARIVLAPERSQTIGRDTTTDAAGNFAAGHAPAGPIGLNVQADGFLSEFRKPIEVELGRFTDHVDFVLHKAPTLSGIVVDDAGQPVEGAKLWGWPKSSGSGAGGKSLANGAFTINLPQDEPYTLESTLDGYESVGVGERSKYYDAGTRDLRIVMKRLASSTLRVEDAVTHAPITKFGHYVVANESDHAEHSSYSQVVTPQNVEHAEGRVTVSFRPGIDAVDVGAPGYETQRFDPEAGAPPGGVFVVDLVPASAVFGIVRVDGAPAANADLRLERGFYTGGKDPLGEVTPKRFVVEQEGAATMHSASDGSFRFENLARGTYRLFAHAVGGQAASVDTFVVEASKPTDLGTIDLVSGASIRGVVLVPPGRTAGGLTVRIDDKNNGEKQVTDSDGRFRFDGLVAGAHQMFLEDAPGSTGAVPPVDVQLAAADVRDVQIDARAFGTCRVELTILLGDRPAAKAQVSLTRPNSSERIELGRTDAQGHVANSAPLASDVGVRIWTADGITLDHPTAKLSLGLDAKIVETIRFEVGSVDVVLPSSLTMPAKCSVNVELTPVAGSTANKMSRYIDLVDATVHDEGVSWVEVGRKLRFENVLAGDWDLVFDVCDKADPTETVQIGPEAFETHPKTMYKGKGTVKVVSGQTATVELH